MFDRPKQSSFRSFLVLDHHPTHTQHRFLFSQIFLSPLGPVHTKTLSFSPALLSGRTIAKGKEFCIQFDMVGKRDPKGKAPMKSVSIIDGDYEYSPRSEPASPGPSNAGRSASRRGSGGGGGSPAPSHVSAASNSRSQPKPEEKQATTSASTSSTPAATSGPPIAASRFVSYPMSWAQQQSAAMRPYINYSGMGMSVTIPTVPPNFAPVGTVFSTSYGMPYPAQDPPAPVNPPDELGPPPPPLPPPAIPPVLNPFGVHFQPQVPGTEMGPMTHHYVPRHDTIGAPGMVFPGQQMQMPGLMVSALVGLFIVWFSEPSGLTSLLSRFIQTHKTDGWNRIENTR